MSGRRIVCGAVLAGAAALLASGCGAVAGSDGASPAAPESQFVGASWVDGGVAPDFALRDQDGRLVRLGAQRGRFVILSFLYTRCPDVCPLIASELNTALRRLGPARGQVRVLAVSVDPRGDSPTAVRRYTRERRLLPEFRYLTGSVDQLEAVWRAYHVAVDPAQLDTVDHTAYELLVDPSGRGRLVYTANVKARDVLHDLRELGLR